MSIRLSRIKKTSAKPRDFDGMLDTGLLVSMYKTKTPFDMWRFNVPRLKEFLAFSVKDRYQLNYFICIKDFNAQTISSLKLNLFFFLIIYCRQHHDRKTICLDIFLLSDRQWGTEHQYLLCRFLSVSILQLIIIYCIYDHDMLHCHSNSVNTGSRLPNISDVRTRKRRNMFGIDMIQNKCICLS